MTEREISDRIVLLAAARASVGTSCPVLYLLAMGAECELKSLLDPSEASILEVLGACCALREAGSECATLDHQSSPGEAVVDGDEGKVGGTG